MPICRVCRTPIAPARYEELMHMTGLARFTTRLAGRLSGGMKQKLGLACTLVRPPELLLLDEPTVGVDPVSRRELWQIVYRLVQQEGMTVLLSTAYLDEAERCDEVILMHDGEVLGHGPPQEFRERSRGRTYMVTAPAASKRASAGIALDCAGRCRCAHPGRSTCAWSWTAMSVPSPPNCCRLTKAFPFSRCRHDWRTVS